MKMELQLHKQIGESMTIKECYEAMGGDYEDVLKRLMNEARIQKFAINV